MRNLSILCFVSAVLGSSSASAINTYKDWDGSSNIGGFGCSKKGTPNHPLPLSTFGQIITIPKGKHTLDKFSFWWKHQTGPGWMVVRGEVYAWGGTMATGNSLYESKPRTVSFTDDAFHKMTFATSLTVTPGARYVIFASTDKDWEQCKRRYKSGWGYVSGRPYPDGTWAYQNNEGNESNWTNAAWQGGGGLDFAFTAILSP